MWLRSQCGCAAAECIYIDLSQMVCLKTSAMFGCDVWVKVNVGIWENTP